MLIKVVISDHNLIFNYNYNEGHDTHVILHTDLVHCNSWMNCGAGMAMVVCVNDLRRLHTKIRRMHRTLARNLEYHENIIEVLQVDEGLPCGPQKNRTIGVQAT